MVRRIIAAMFMATALLSTAAQATETGSDGKILNGMAPLYVPFPGSAERVVRAALTLPEYKSNKNWYSNWVMVVGTAKGASHAVFVQVGIIRRPGEYEGARTFIAWQNASDSSVNYQEYGSVGDGSHTIEIKETSSGFTFFVDEKPVGSPIAIPFTKAYAQVGPEVYAEGDTLVGAEQNITIGSGSTKKNVVGDNVCRYINHGVQLSPGTDGAFTASGIFTRSEPSQFLGDCTGI